MPTENCVLVCLVAFGVILPNQGTWCLAQSEAPKTTDEDVARVFMWVVCVLFLGGSVVLGDGQCNVISDPVLNNHVLRLFVSMFLIMFTNSQRTSPLKRNLGYPRF